MTSCTPQRQQNVSGCAAACSAVPNCSHASAVFRPRARVTWCYLRSGTAWITPTRCAQNIALRRIPLQPLVIVVHKRGPVIFAANITTATEWAERTNCSARATEVELRGMRDPRSSQAPRASLDALFASVCGLGPRDHTEGLAAFPSEEVKARFQAVHVAGFTQRRLGAHGNLGRSRLQMRCVYQLAKAAAARLVQAHHLDESVRKPQAHATHPLGLTACETGFNAGHSAVVLLSALESAALDFQTGQLPPTVHYYGWDLGESPWTRPAAALLNGTIFPGQVHVAFEDAALVARQPHSALPRCALLSIDGDHTISGVLRDWRTFRALLPRHQSALIFIDDIDEYHPVWREPGLVRIGCVSLSGVADDRKRPQPMTASPSFCIAESTPPWRVVASVPAAINAAQDHEQALINQR